MQPELSPDHITDAKAAIMAYGRARQQFAAAQHRMGDWLVGNDNKVGSAGEFWAKLQFIENGWSITEILKSNHPEYDFRCERSGEFARVSVKVVSDESSKGKQVKPKSAQSQWTHLVLLLLTDDLSLRKIGIATRAQFEAAVSRKWIGLRPGVSRSWLGRNGWMTRVGADIRTSLD